MAQKIIALDAGHGMRTAGKRCLKSLDPNETREWFLNDRIMDKVEAMLAAYDCRVIRVGDTTGAKDVSLASRVRTANAAKADIYISMHHNAGLNGRRGGGTVVFYSSSNPERGVQAQKLYRAIVFRTKLQGNRSQKVVKKGFYVIKNTNMPAFLIENGFMDSPQDVPIILSEQHANRTAEGVVDFVTAMLQLKSADGTAGSAGSSGTGNVLAAGGVTGNVTATGAGAGKQPASGTYYPAYTGKKATLSAAMTSLGINSSYSYRKQIAAANGISGYCGTAGQNTQMYNMLAAGLLKRI